MGATADFSIPWPDGSDPFIPGGNAGDFKAMAERIDEVLGLFAPTNIVSAIPSSASVVDGQVINFATAAMASADITWRLRYKESTDEWKCEGAIPWKVQSAPGGAGITAGGTYAYAADGDPVFGALPAGKFLISWGCIAQGDPLSNSMIEMVPAIGSTTPLFQDVAYALTGIPPGGSSAWSGTISRTKEFTANAGDAIRAKFKGTGAHVIWERWMTLVPISLPGV